MAAKRKHYSPEIKGQAMAEMAVGRATVSEAARKFGVPRGTVAKWSAMIRRDVKETDAQETPVGEETKETPQETECETEYEAVDVEVVDDAQALQQAQQTTAVEVHRYVAASMRALRNQVELAGEKGWLRRYSPDQVAALHTAIAVWGFRCLAGLTGSGGGDDPDDYDAGDQPGSIESSGVD